MVSTGNNLGVQQLAKVLTSRGKSKEQGDRGILAFLICLIHCTLSLEDEKSWEEEDSRCICFLLHGLLQLPGLTGLVPLCSLLIWEVVEERMDKGVVMVLGLEKKVLLVVNLHV